MDLQDVDAANALVLYVDEVQEGERPMRSAWVEMGYALGKGKLVIVIHPELTDCLFVQLPEVFEAASWQEALNELAQYQTVLETVAEPLP
jgi:nucleoside 2-deoxyribosyltransferase